jgi:WD40 repeat protein
VVIHEDGTLPAFPEAGGPAIWSAHGALLSTWGGSLAGDGRRLAVGGRSWTDPAVEVWDLDQHAPVFAEPWMVAAYRTAWSGPALAVAVHAGTPLLYREGPGSEPERIRVGDEAVQAVAWSPDGSLIATGSYDGSTSIFRASTLERLHFVDQSPRSIVDLEFAGPTLISGSGDGWIHPVDLGLVDTFADGSTALTRAKRAPPGAPQQWPRWTGHSCA